MKRRKKRRKLHSLTSLMDVLYCHLKTRVCVCVCMRSAFIYQEEGGNALMKKTSVSLIIRWLLFPFDISYFE